MAIRPKWLKDICSVVFSAYYLVWASDGDEVVSTCYDFGRHLKISFVASELCVQSRCSE
jgi:hypothetical protein